MSGAKIFFFQAEDGIGDVVRSRGRGDVYKRQAMSDVCVRPATPADLPGIHGIYNEAVRNTTATYDYEPRDLVYRERWFQEHERERYPVFVLSIIHI